MPFGYAVSSAEMKAWYYRAMNNASYDRQDEIWAEVDGITWVRKDIGGEYPRKNDGRDFRDSHPNNPIIGLLQLPMV